MAWKGCGDTISIRVYGRYELAPVDEEYVPRVGDVGTLIKVDMDIDMTTGWSETKFYVQKADGTETTWIATINTKYLEYITTDGGAGDPDFNQKGEYKLTPYGEQA